MSPVATVGRSGPDTIGAAGTAASPFARSRGACTRHLTNPVFAYVYGVAIAPGSDCWASVQNKSFKAILVYFAHCRGGLDIDANGNLVTISSTSKSQLFIYSGCNPACALVRGPFPLKGAPLVYCHLDGASNKFVVANVDEVQVDVYSYSPSAVKHLYSITNSFSPSDDPTAAAFSPNSKE